MSARARKFLIRSTLIFLSTTLFVARAAAAEKPLGQWLVVTAPAFRAELAPLIEHRQAEGFKVVIIETTNVLSPEQPAALLQARVRQVCERAGGTTYVLLVGDMSANPTNAEQTVVPPLLGAIERMKGELTDYGYGLNDTNGVPAVAVGRFPARTVGEVRSMVQKTLKLERAQSSAAWRNQLLLLMGNPGGGDFAEMMMEPAVGARLKRLHAAWNLQGISCSTASRYYLPGARARENFFRSLEAGGLFAFFMGHSTSSNMWLVNREFIDRNAWRDVNMAKAPAIFFTSGCYALQIAGREDEGYGFVAMRNPNGPAAFIGATGESYTAPGFLASDGLLECFSQPPFPSRLADYWLAVQAGLARGKIHAGAFNLYDQFDGSKGKVPLDVQRREHLEMWMLLGDPALRLPLVPMNIVIDPPAPVKVGMPFTVTGTLPDSLARPAVLRVSLERPLSSVPHSLEKLPPNSPENQSARERVSVSNHERANNFVLNSTQVIPDKQTFTCSLMAPSIIPWSNLVIRVTATTSNQAAVGVLAVPAPQLGEAKP
jgi:hypothetical protein